MQRIVITGAAGVVGEVLRRDLPARFDVSGVDRRRVAGDKRMARANMVNRRAVEKAFRGADAVVDLAGIPHVDTPWSLVSKNNIPATINALAAARAAGVRRVVFASSNHVTGGYERDWPYAAVVAGEYEALEPGQIPLLGPAAAIRPDSAYAIGKALGEAAARYYVDSSDLTAICLRIGSVNPDDRPLVPRHYATWLSHRDLVSLVACALEAPAAVRFGVYYGVSDNTWRFWDIANAQTDIGYEPEDNAERFRG